MDSYSTTKSSEIEQLKMDFMIRCEYGTCHKQDWQRAVNKLENIRNADPADVESLQNELQEYGVKQGWT